MAKNHKKQNKKLKKQLKALRKEMDSRTLVVNERVATEKLSERGLAVIEPNTPENTQMAVRPRQAPGAGIGHTIMPKSFSEIVIMSKQMATAGPMIGAAFRNNEGACMAIITQACRWGMDPFAISTEAHVVNNSLGYSGKLVAAILEAHAPIQGRLRYKYNGEGDNLSVTVSGLFEGETEPHELTTPTVGELMPKKNDYGKLKGSPLWASDPMQQLAYYGARAWGRRYSPETIMGLKTHEEAVMDAEREEKPKTNTQKRLETMAQKKADKEAKAKADKAKELDDVEDAEIIDPDAEPQEGPTEPEGDASPIEPEYTEKRTTEAVEAKESPSNGEIDLPDQAHDWLERLDTFEDADELEKVWKGQADLVWVKDLSDEQRTAVLEANAKKLAEITGE